MTLEPVGIIVSAVSSLAVALCVVATFVYMRRGKWDEQAARFTKLETVAEAALQEAAEAKIELRHATENTGRDCKDLHERVTLLAANFGMYREKVASELVNKELLREFEGRIVQMQTASENRLAQSIEELTKRFDRLIDAALRNVRDQTHQN